MIFFTYHNKNKVLQATEPLLVSVVSLIREFIIKLWEKPTLLQVPVNILEKITTIRSKYFASQKKLFFKFDVNKMYLTSLIMIIIIIIKNCKKTNKQSCISFSWIARESNPLIYVTSERFQANWNDYSTGLLNYLHLVA